MDARSKRREATRRQLEQQLRERQAREARRKRATLIASVVGTVAVIALVIVLVVTLGGGSDNGKKKNQAGSSDAVSATATPSATASSSAPPLAAPAACTKATGKATAAFDGVSVANAVNLKKDPKVTSKSSTTPKALACADLVVGKGKAASAASTVSVQYSGVLYKNGMQFDSSWARGGKPASFPLKTGPGGVIPGFSQGIGGTGKVAPMRVGGRRIIIMPSQLGYGSTAQQAIPANSTLVFVVDLVKVS